MKHLILLLLFILPVTVMASGKKTPPAAISFHMEGSRAESPKFARMVKTLAGEKYFRKTPEISTKDIVEFSPFPADDNSTYGVVFKLTAPATRRLMAATTQNRGKLLLALVNGEALGVVRIDKPVTDGVLVIWSGVKQKEIKLYDMVCPRIGEDKKTWKKRLKAEKKKRK